MNVRDRSTHGPGQENLGIEMPLPARADSHASPAASSMGSARDSSDLSPAAHVASQVMQMPEIRMDRIASLQQRIASGSYRIAPQQVADAMLRNVAG